MLMVTKKSTATKKTTVKKSTKAVAKAPEKKEKKFTFDLTPLAIYLLPQFAVAFAAVFILGDSFSEHANTIGSISLILAAIIMLIVYRKRIAEDAKRLKKSKPGIGFAIGMALLVLLVNFIATTVIGAIFGSVSENQSTLESGFASTLVITLLMTVFSAPVNEEFVFRAMLGKIFKNDIVFYIISALTFAIIHTGFNLFTISVIPYALVGLGFAFIFRKTGDNIVASILAHFINNLAAVAMVIIPLLAGGQ